MTESRLITVLNEIDAANARDPDMVDDAGARRPAALVYGQRMSAALERLAPEASATLQIAARGQHIERWTVPRASYSEGRIGYLRWRKDLQAYHAGRLDELMAAAGYAQADRQRVGALIRKERLKQDPETQTLEDVACLVFLEHHAGELFERYDDDKVIDILQKTARKMSPEGLAAAGNLGLAGRPAALLGRALGEQGTAP